MPSTSHSLLNYLRVWVGAWRDDPRDDTTLLARFAESGDEAAFRVLVCRHGPLVWQTCRRVLGDTHDAEDAFQTAFLALAHKAGQLAIKNPAGWLHRVARRAALAAQAGARRRQGLARRLWATRQPAAAEETSRAELFAVLDEELADLPERLRVPLVLRYLEGKTLAEVAQILGCSLTPVTKRLARGEAILRQRLERRGLSVGVLSVGVLLGRMGTDPAVPTCLIGSTARAAVAFRSGTLTSGATEMVRAVLGSLPSSFLGTMIMRKSLLIVLACFLGLGSATLVTYRSLSAKPDEPGEAGTAAAPASRQPGATARVDCYGDPLPAGALARMGTTRLWNGQENVPLAFSPDGKTLAAQGQGTTVCLWDAATGKEIRRLADAGRFVALSPDGQKLVTAMSNELDVRLWEVTTGKLLRELKYQGPKRQEEHLLGVTFLPNGKMLAVREFLNAPARARKGQPADWRMCWWEIATGKEISQQKREARSWGAAAFSPDGKMLAAAGSGGEKIYLWEVATGKEIRQLTKGHLDCIQTIAFSRDGKTLASGEEKQICVWEVATGKLIHRLNIKETLGGRCHPILFSPDGKTLVGGKVGQCWDVATGKELCSFGWPELDGGDEIRFAAFSPNGKIVATGEPRGVISLWEVATGKEISPRKGHQGAIYSITYSPDGKTLVSGSRDRTVGLWEVATGKELRRLPRHDGWGVHSVSYSPDGKLLASGDSLKGYLWEAATGKKIREFSEPRSVMAFSPDSKILAAGRMILAAGRIRMMKDDSFAVSLWDVATGKEIHNLPTGQEGNIGLWTVAFSPDGRMLAATGKHDTVGLWEMASGKLIGELNLSGQKQGGGQKRLMDLFVQSFTFSPDGRMLAAAAGSILPSGELGYTASLWDVASGKKIHQLKGLTRDTSSGWSFTFSPDGRVLAAAGGEDRKVHLWEVATGKEIGQLRGHRSTVRTVAFSPDGKTLASGSEDTTCLIWDATLFLGRLKPIPVPSSTPRALSKEQLDTAWANLAKDAALAYAAIRDLQAVPAQAIPLLRERVRPVAPLADPQKLQRWIADLDDGSFTVRDKARREIEKLGEVAIPALRQALKGQPALEARRRLQDLLAELEPKGVVVSPRGLREFRAVQVLESIGTSEAQQVLQALAKGVAEASLTMEAKAAQARLAKRSATKP